MFITESWFWRGTQSAIFYYASCSPYMEYKYKRKRRKEATQSEKEKQDIIMSQPGVVVQPGPFQTNPDWAEEIIMGPGPPKGWKKEKILQGYTETARELYRSQSHVPHPPAVEISQTEAGAAKDFAPVTDTPPEVDTSRPTPTVSFSEPDSMNVAKPSTIGTEPHVERMSPISEMPSRATVSTSSSDEVEQPSRARPSMERRLSSAVENIKDTIKGWNLKRYEREDEILSGLNERLSRMWDKATSYGTDNDGRKASFTYGRKRSGTTGTNESERYDYQRAVRNPEINELHPPTVSKLPMTRDEAAWMLLPPPSAAVMAGRSRPHDEPALRWPLAIIGRAQPEAEQLPDTTKITRTRLSESTSLTNDSQKIPDLSNSSSDEAWSDEDEENDHRFSDDQKRHSAPVEGWLPVLPKASLHPLHPPEQHWERDNALRPRVW